MFSAHPPGKSRVLSQFSDTVQRARAIDGWLLWFPSARPFVSRGAKIAFFLDGRFLTIFGRLSLRRCVSLRFHVFFMFLVPARPSILATMSWREPNKKFPLGDMVDNILSGNVLSLKPICSLRLHNLKGVPTRFSHVGWTSRLHLSSSTEALAPLVSKWIGIGIYLGCFLPGGNSAHNTIIITESRYSHQKITHSKEETRSNVKHAIFLLAFDDLGLQPTTEHNRYCRAPNQQSITPDARDVT